MEVRGNYRNLNETAWIPDQVGNDMVWDIA